LSVSNVPRDFASAKWRATGGRGELEKKSGRKVVTNENYLVLTQMAKKAKRIK